MSVPINYLAVIVAAFANMVLGALWYGPLFGEAWKTMMAFSPEKLAAMKAKGMAMSYGLMAIGSILMAWVLAHAIIFAGAFLEMGGLSTGLMAGFMNWLGFVVPVTVGAVLWEGRSWKLWWLNASYSLVGFLIMGAILSVWM